VGGVTVNVQGAATEGYPVLYDIFYLVQYLLDIKDKFILPINWRSLIKQNDNYQQAYFRHSRGAWNKIKTHFTEILIIIAVTKNNGCMISTEGEFLFQKRLSLRSFLLGSLLFTVEKLSKTIFMYLKNLFSLICGFRFPVSGFWFLVPDSGFQFLGFRVAPSLTECLLHIQFTHGCYPA